MTSIIDKIKASLEPLVGAGHFYYNDGDGLNIDLDNANYPCAFAQLIETGTITDTFGTYHERVTLGIYFAANVSDIELNPLKNEQILTELKKTAFVWLASLRRDDNFTSTEVVGTDRVYIKSDRYDVRLTAYVVNVTFEEAQGWGECDIVCPDCGS